jgi:hypothetical protein
MGRPPTSSRVGATFQGLLWTAFPLVFVIVGIGFVVVSAYQAATYLPVAAVVDKVRGGDDASDSVAIDYSYTVQGRRYTGTDSADEDNKARFNELRQYKAGAKLTVYYDPRDPARSQYEVKAQAGGLVFVIFILPFLSIGLNQLWFGLTGKELLRSRQPNAQSDTVPGGGLFWIFVLVCVAGAASQVFFSIVLSWPWSLVAGLAILFGAIPAVMLWAARLRERRRSTKSVELREVRAAQHADATASPQDAAQLEAARSASNQPSVRTQYAIMLGFTVFWCSLTGVFTYFAVGSLVKHQYARLHYAVTEGVIISSRIKTSQSSEGGSTASPRIKYRYALDGKEFVGEQYDFAGGSSSDHSYAQRAVSENPPGKRVAVYYDPAKPNVAILHLGAPPISYFLLLFLQPFILVALALPIGCICMPFANMRTKRFLASDAELPWSIPGWGVLEQDFDGLVLRSRRNLLAPFGLFFVVYGVACFFAIFVVAFFFNGFGDANVEAIRWSFIVAAAAGAVAFLGGLFSLGRRSRLLIDTSGKRLVVRDGGREYEAQLADVEGLRLRNIRYRAGVSVNGTNVRRLQLEALVRAGEPIPLHGFKGQSGSNDQSVTIARKAQQELARIVGCPAVDGIVG